MAKKYRKVDVASITLWGREVGAIAWDDGRGTGSFEYTPEFARSGLEISPLKMPLAAGRFYQFPELNRQTFHGLPGLLADALPDRFGNLLIDQWLSRQGRTAREFSPVERLCYMGSRSMGALEFTPALLKKRQGNDTPLEVAELVQLAREILKTKGQLSTSFMEDREEALETILRVGTSAGGARAKAVIAFNPTTEEVRSGQIDIPPGYEAWLLKFDGVDGDHLATPAGYGRIEYAYHRMARAAGITMEDCRLLPDRGGRSHFMTRRFDRLPGNRKLHMASLSGLAHYDFNQPGAHGYEDAFAVMRELGLGYDAADEMFRRMVFNILARNQDDHPRNISFLMDEAGRWSLAPGYDITWSYNPRGDWTSLHQMTANGKRDGFTREDLLAVAENAGVKKPMDIIHQVVSAVADWEEFAEAASVPTAMIRSISESHRLDLAPRAL
ncbi:MAG: type II toxin-antitoxin system HipA family toxin [Candidatus Sumerlaeia bacterium]|nr:type II toxin-antitoxin system HipA family toxin [Candidatus Sumerlaeia bacterium]